MLDPPASERADPLAFDDCETIGRNPQIVRAH
jgi:hypothetical protein